MSPLEKGMAEAARLVQDAAYSELLASATAGDRAGFMSAWRASRSQGRNFPKDPMGVLASHSGLICRWLIEVFCNQAEDLDLRTTAFHAVRNIGAGAVPILRTGWDCEQGLYGRGRIHQCMMDVINGAATNKTELPPMAQKEILLWMETFRTGEPRVRIWAVMILVSWLPYCPPGLVDALRNQLADFATSEVPAGDDIPRSGFASIQRLAARALGDLPGQ